MERLGEDARVANRADRLTTGTCKWAAGSMVAWSATKSMRGKGACFMPHEHFGAESEGAPQIALRPVF